MLDPTQITTVAEVVAVFRNGGHFVGETCAYCDRTANVPHGPLECQWVCVCGWPNVLLLGGQGCRPHEKPDMGPSDATLQKIRAAMGTSG